MLNLAAALQRNAVINPDKIAIVCGETQITYAQFNAIASQIANGLKARGIQPGDRVALSCPNLPFFPLVYYGIQKAGAVTVPLNVLLRAREIQYHLEDSQAKFYFCFEGVEGLPMAEAGIEAFQKTDACEQLVVMTADQTLSEYQGFETLTSLIHGQSADCDYAPRNADDTAVILYTSGTTGQPKGAELTQANQYLNAMAAQNLMQMEGRDVHLVTLPLFHTFGQTVNMNAPVSLGCTMVLVPRFDPTLVMGLIEKHGVTLFAGVPTMYIGMNLCQAESDCSSLRIGVSGGASLPLKVLKTFEEKFGVPILEGYGLSETSPIACFNHLDKPRLPGSVGQPIQGVEVRVVDDKDQPVALGEPGEIVIRGHNVMKGYLNRPEEKERALRHGWFHSGDVGRFDEQGNLFIVDRVKDLIIRGGFNVYPREIEEVFMTHPAVAMVAVIGVPSREYGEDIKACVVLKEGQFISAEELRDWGKTQLAAYKYPRQVEIRDALPMNATGKILKKDLKSEITQPV
ncbi:long-chain fatty acid--CoA ligase [Photobacterium sp. 1_MG-2023]|uniref:long-chain-fatty-acid--CoA ligase n=1 Tax=Photobacterium sp. 1_MG-2023 TaxID=3062646 RepID=UPI0026E1928B|nr:long-chain fatty acid--CoA ligase [Photobacterium sp. 1_MG-2023]MDO6708854.1 long-chain fatty acid--CoA ligase [Photobacterium sp. 1_MG-2023]